ncbi:MAG: class I SAM-dependent rRNA methyltransferase [Bacteroidales bacterium]|jgi:23S rRNA (cytosine1962-C5)-methyltransferase|nr:class I SAM-dependent rRNA methyltransferase [Bacteroidales bacterium]
MNYTKIILKPKKEESIYRFHPWIFSGAINKIENDVAEGDIVEIYNFKNEFCALGHYQIGSIAVRIFSFTKINPDYNFWKSQIEKAYELRKNLNLITNSNNCYRLVHGEGDMLPGLIIDIYGNTAIIQAHSIGMHKIREEIANIVCEILSPIIKNVYYKSNSTLPYKANLQNKEEFLIKNSNSDNFTIENGLNFKIDWLEGQKTGFFIDQRENRKLLEQYSNNKTVLNMFCYTGGFSVYALRGNAKLVHSVDSSKRAIELTTENIQSNFPNNTNHQEFAIDTSDFFKNSTEKYDVIILDPPAFAKHKNALHNALQGYKNLNVKALEKINSGGILFTFSCSQTVSQEQFRLAVFSAATISKRNVKILHQLTQPADHPINIYHPESEYLKGLVAWVE